MDPINPTAAAPTVVTPTEGSGTFLGQPDGTVAPAAAPTQVVVVDPAAAAPEAAKTGLDQFSNLWETKPVDKSAEGAVDEVVPPFDPTAILNDQKAVDQLLDSVDFTSSFSKETQELLTAGDPKGMQAAMSDVAKASMLQALKMSTALNRKYTDEQLALQQNTTNTSINDSLDKRELANVLPQINHPVVEAGVKNYVKQLKAQNPSITPTEIAAAVKTIMGEVNNSLNPAKPTQQQQAAEEEVDWMEWANSGPTG